MGKHVKKGPKHRPEDKIHYWLIPAPRKPVDDKPPKHEKKKDEKKP